jgi:DNA-binding transcriptional ArsR family regulator
MANMTSSLDAVFAALSDPARRLILETLGRRGARPAGDFGVVLPHLSQPAVSRHLKVLREAGLVTVRAEGAVRIYALSPTALGAAAAWLVALSAAPPGKSAHGEPRLER